MFERLKDRERAKDDKWISADEAMQKLRISSKTTLQKLRDEGKIRFSPPEKKHIVYDLKSIYGYCKEYSEIRNSVLPQRTPPDENPDAFLSPGLI